MRLLVVIDIDKLALQGCSDQTRRAYSVKGLERATLLLT